MIRSSIRCQVKLVMSRVSESVEMELESRKTMLITMLTDACSDDAGRSSLFCTVCKCRIQASMSAELDNNRHQWTLDNKRASPSIHRPLDRRLLVRLLDFLAKTQTKATRRRSLDFISVQHNGAAFTTVVVAAFTRLCTAEDKNYFSPEQVVLTYSHRLE